MLFTHHREKRDHLDMHDVIQYLSQDLFRQKTKEEKKNKKKREPKRDVKPN